MIYTRELLVGRVNALARVERFQGCTRNRRESVAEHTFTVVLYAHWLAQWFVYDSGINLNWPYLTGRALLHDLDEGASGDIPRPFKYSSGSLASLLKTAGREAAREILKDALHGRVLEHSLDVVSNYMTRQSEHTKAEDWIVEFSDFLSTVSYVLQEVESGNRAILTQVQGLREEAQQRFYHVVSDTKSPYNCFHNFFNETLELLERA